PATVHPGAKLAVGIGKLNFSLERARRRIEGGREANDLAPEALARKRIELDVRVLTDGDGVRVAFADGDEHAQRVRARDREHRPAAWRAHERAGIEASLDDDAVERRLELGLAEPNRQRRRLRVGRALRRLRRRERGVSVLELGLRDDALRREL